MRDIFEFFSAAMPWIAMGLLLAIFFIRETRRKKDNDRSSGQKRKKPERIDHTDLIQII